MISTEERKRKYEIKQQELLKKYHELVFKGLFTEKFQARIKDCFESLYWNGGIGPESAYGFTISNFSIWLDTWQVNGINKYVNLDRRFWWEGDLVYVIVVSKEKRTREVAFDAFTNHQLFSICMACLRQAIYDIGLCE